jgi:hypothetical protein
VCVMQRKVFSVIDEAWRNLGRSSNLFPFSLETIFSVDDNIFIDKSEHFVSE